jgi:hypothetical protein
MLCASASTNEVGYLTHKTMRATGMLHSTIKHVYDTVQRWQVLPRHLDVVR